jgi:hypothetical protein
MRSVDAVGADEVPLKLHPPGSVRRPAAVVRRERSCGRLCPDIEEPAARKAGCQNDEDERTEQCRPARLRGEGAS